jgi:hypothetical protein
MTYPALKLTDGQILDVLMASRRHGVTTMVHCEVHRSQCDPLYASETDWLSPELRRVSCLPVAR